MATWSTKRMLRGRAAGGQVGARCADGGLDRVLVGAGRRRRPRAPRSARSSGWGGRRSAPRSTPSTALTRSSIVSGCTFTPPTLMISEDRPRKRMRSPSTSTRSPVARHASGSTGGLAVVAEHPGAGADPQLAVDDPHADVGVVAALEHRRPTARPDRRASTRSSRTRRRRTPARCGRPGRSRRSSASSGPGMASPPRVICRSSGTGPPSARSSASRKRQYVGVALAWVTPSSRIAASPSRGRRGAGATRVAPAAKTCRRIWRPANWCSP